MFLRKFKFLQFSRKKVFSFFYPIYVKLSSKKKRKKENEFSIVKLETWRFKTRPNGLLYDLFSQSYIRSNYRQFFIIIGTITPLTLIITKQNY